MRGRYQPGISLKLLLEVEQRWIIPCLGLLKRILLNLVQVCPRYFPQIDLIFGRALSLWVSQVLD